MDSGDLYPLIIPGIVAIVVALVNLRPKKSDPAQIMHDELERMTTRIKSLEESSSEQWAVIDDLRKKVGRLYDFLGKLKDYVRDLEEKLREVTGAPHERPKEIDDIFKDT